MIITMIYSQAIVNQITDECCDVIEEMLNELGVTNYVRSRRYIYGPCPIHGGDNPASWNLYPGGEQVRGIWRCYTKNCHAKWKTTLVGFVHAILSRENPDAKWTDAVAWMGRFLGYKSTADIKLPDKATLQRKQFNQITQKLNTHRYYGSGNGSKTWKPEQYRRQMIIPDPYYVLRGYKESTLRKYDVGHAERTNRSVVPIYNETHDTIVGMTARSNYERCPKCKYYHSPDDACPANLSEQINACKWKNSPGFEASQYLYNLWFAKKHIEDSNTAIIVEGPGDVWRLHEEGIHNVVAMFGTDLTDEQLLLLECSGAMNVIVMTDNDEAGKEAAVNLKKNYKGHIVFTSHQSMRKTLGNYTQTK